MNDNAHQLDQVILVDINDQEVGVMDKVEAHRSEGKLHRASSVFLFRKINGEWELLMQQRSEFKIVGAHQWANTVCGNVRPGESYEDCARRRLREEIGITEAVIKSLYKFEYHAVCNEEFSEHEFVTIFAGLYDGEIKMNPREVEDTQWVKWAEVLSDKTELNVAPWFMEFMKEKELVSTVQQYLVERGT